MLRVARCCDEGSGELRFRPRAIDSGEGLYTVENEGKARNGFTGYDRVALSGCEQARLRLRDGGAFSVHMSPITDPDSRVGSKIGSIWFRLRPGPIARAVGEKNFDAGMD